MDVCTAGASISAMKQLLWIGDAGCPSGFARCTHKILDNLRDKWKIAVLGLNYRGDPHPYQYPIYPAGTYKMWDGFGFNRVQKLVKDLKPDVVVVQNDPWNVPAYLDLLKGQNVVAVMPVDGKNCKGADLNGLTMGIFWTGFGLNEAAQGGYRGPATVIPLGVDLQTYYPSDKLEARKALKLPAHVQRGVIVGNVNRNQVRKRLDITIDVFAKWVKRDKLQDVFLFLYVAPTGDTGYDCRQLAQYYGISDQVITMEPETWRDIGEDNLRLIYNSFDLQVNTGQGEGWGLTTMEGMACGVPQIVPAWSALEEWAASASYQVPCSDIAVTPGNINMIGGVIDRGGLLKALDSLYRDNDYRAALTKLGLDLVSEPQYRWENIAAQYDKILASVAESVLV
jgi:D-inositol-3-phosphate glycosyltransferase